MKRFWKDVDVENRTGLVCFTIAFRPIQCILITSDTDGLVVTLDKRPLKTPTGQMLVLPHNKVILASLIAHEWDIQDRALQNHALPLVI